VLSRYFTEVVVFRHAFGLLLLTIVIAATGCSSGTEPVLRDIDVARTRWLAQQPSSYVFEEAVEGSFPKSPYYKVTVVANSIVAVVNEKGAALPLPAGAIISLDSLWNEIISERAKRNLNSAVFSEAGVPIEADWGPWLVDGGVRYFVRNFRRGR
jgi:hypothetical protein